MTAPTPDWAATLRGLADGASRLLAGLAPVETTDQHPTDEHPTDEHPADRSAECRHCPVCTALAVVRGRRPDLSEALADVLATAAAALRDQARTAGDRDQARTAGDRDQARTAGDRDQARTAGDRDQARTAGAPATTDPDTSPEETVHPTAQPASVQHIEVA